MGFENRPSPYTAATSRINRQASQNAGGSKLGAILLREKLITSDDLETLLSEQRQQPGLRLASVAAEHGKIADLQLLRALSEQHGVPGIDLSQIVIPLTNLKLIPVEVAKQNAILPILAKTDRIFLAMADPSAKHIIADIEFATGRKVIPYVALHKNLIEVIEYCYRAADKGEDYYIGPFVPGDNLASLGLSRDARSQAGHAGHAGSTSQPENSSGDPSLIDTKPGKQLTGHSIKPPPVAPFDELDRSIVRHSDASMLSAASATEEEQTAQTQASDERKTVLIVDDDDDIRRLLAGELQAQGYRIIEARTGSDALRALRRETPQAVILDIELPDMHGFEICRRLREAERYKHTPIITTSSLQSGWRLAADLRESYGVHEFIEKPFAVETIVRVLKSAVTGATPPSAEVMQNLSSEAQSALEQGIDAYERGHLEEAIMHLKRGVRLEPLAFRLHYHLGLLYGLRSKVDDAIEELETAVDLQPTNFFALKNLAVLYQKVGFRHKAIEAWERALVSAPDEQTRHNIKDYLVSLF